MGRGKKTLIGCGIGCGVFLLMVLGVAIAFGIWLNSPGELLEPQQLLGADTTVYVEWTLRLEDPGTEGFVLEVVDQIQTIQKEEAEELPPWLRGWVLQSQSRKARKNMLRVFPMVAAWTVRPGATENEDLHLLSASVKNLGHQLIVGDWILGFALGRSEGIEVHRHRDEKIYVLPINKRSQIAAFLRSGHVFVSSDVDTAKIAVDRLAEGGESRREPSDLDRVFASTEGKGPLRGAISNTHGELGRLWHDLDPESAPEELDAVQALSVSGGLQEDGSLTGTLQFHCNDPQRAEALLEPLAQALRERSFFTDIAMETRATRADDRIDVTFRLPELARFLSLERIQRTGSELR